MVENSVEILVASASDCESWSERTFAEIDAVPSPRGLPNPRWKYPSSPGFCSSLGTRFAGVSSQRMVEISCAVRFSKRNIDS